MKLKRKEKLEGRIVFNVPASTERDYKFIRSKDYEIHEALREHAVKLISETKDMILKSED